MQKRYRLNQSGRLTHWRDVVREIRIPCVARCVAVIMAALLSVMSQPAKAGGNMSQRQEMLLSECEKASQLRKYGLMQRRGEELKRLGKAEGNERAEMAGESYVLRGIVQRRDTVDIARRIALLQEKVDEAEKKQDWEMVAILSGAVSLYHHFVASDFSQASLYSFKRLEAGRKLNDPAVEVSALSNLASIYFTKQEDSGYTYALEAYGKAKEIKAYSDIYVTACNLANYLFNQKKPDEALQYLNEALSVAEALHMESERTYLNSFFGDIYNGLGRYGEAEKYYRLSMDDNAETTNYDKLYARLCYAQFMASRGDNAGATAMLEKVAGLADEYRIHLFDTEIYIRLSDCYERSGNPAKALEAYRLYHAAYEKLTTEANAKEFAILDLRYRVAEEKSKNAAQSVELMKRGRILLITIAAAVILLVTGLFIYLRMRKKMQTDKETVRRYLENLENERRLRHQLESAIYESRHPSPGGLNEDKQQELFGRFTQMMENDRIYRNPDLSLEKAAEMLQTNRTYLSQVVNEQSGLSFPVFINSYRLKEAIELLSDPKNEEPLKSISYSVGFSTPSGFYTLFRQKTGMAPSVFRQNVKDLNAVRQ